ncbi:ATP-binding protein [Candidatus Micrarchaeota archaeon]|nr:ATP-binding protein [Candidatus Micrarchaeota archaeon]
MKLDENIQSGSLLRFREFSNRDLGERMIFAHPPEPPSGLLLNDPLNSIYIGRTKVMKVPFYWTFDKLTNPHIAIVGVTGAGKSYLVKTFLTRAALIWRTNALIIDWAGEYVDWVEQTGGKVVELGGKNTLNIMDLGGNSPLNRTRQIMRTLEILLDSQARDDEKRVMEEAIEEAYLNKGFSLHTKNQTLTPPTLKDVHAILLKKAKKAESVWVKEYILNSAKMIGRFTKKGMDFLAQQSSLELGKLTSSGLVDIVLKKLPDEDFRVLAGLFILQYLKEKMREEEWSAQKGLKLYVVLDEAWKVAKDDRSDAIMIVREGRKYKFGLIVASQNPTDIHEAIFSNVGTTFILNLKFQRYKEYVRESLKYSDFVAEAIEKFGVGDAAVNLMFSSKTDFSRTFLMDKIHGEDPLEQMTVLTPDGELLFDKHEIKRMLSYEGISYGFSHLIKDDKLDSLDLLKWLESQSIPRSKIIGILNYLGFEMDTIRKLFKKLRDNNGGD